MGENAGMGTARSDRIATEIERELAAFANRARSELNSSGYAPSALRWAGASVPQLRSVVRKYAQLLKDAPAADVRAVALRLVKGRGAEARQVGYELIERRKDVRSSLTRAQVEALGRGNDNWASVDGFSAYVAGPAWKRRLLADADVMRWAKSTNPWWRRTALASAVTLNRRTPGSTGDAPRTLRVCRALAADRHPLVIKAVSWALRSLVAHDPDAVRSFIEERKTILAPSVVREVRTKLTTGRKAG